MGSTSTRTYTLPQLAEAVGMSPRNVRAYQARGLIDPPHRVGRSASYDEEHVRRLIGVRDAVKQGVSLKRLTALVAEGRLEELERVVRRLRPEGEPRRIDLTEARGGQPEEILPPVLEHLSRTAPEAVRRLTELGVLSRQGGVVLADASLAGPIHELYAAGAAVLPHALTTAVAVAESDLDSEAALGAGGVRTGGPHDRSRIVDLTTQVHRAVLSVARETRETRAARA